MVRVVPCWAQGPSAGVRAGALALAASLAVGAGQPTDLLLPPPARAVVATQPNSSADSSSSDLGSYLRLVAAAALPAVAYCMGLQCLTVAPAWVFAAARGWTPQPMMLP